MTISDGPSFPSGVVLPPPAATIAGWSKHCSRASRATSRRREYARLVVDYYEWVTATYDSWGGPCFHFAAPEEDETFDDALARLHSEVATAARLGDGSVALDLGCGLGFPTLAIATTTGARLLGINLSPRQLAQAAATARARRLECRVGFLRADFMTLPLPPSSVDAVLFFESPCHAPDKLRFARECARVLRPDGRLSGTDWGWRRPPTTERERQLAETICSHHAVPILTTSDDFVAGLEKAGLAVEEVIDLAEQPGFLENWSGFEPPKGPFDPTTELVLQGAVALRDAAHEGLFGVFRYVATRTQ